MQHIAIIGAGLSGLLVARALRDHAAVTIFEKSRAAGGRMATRRAGAYQFDHGAQFFKARTMAFNDYLRPFIERGLVATWDGEFVELARQRVLASRSWDDSVPHYVAVPGMNELARHLSEGLDIQWQRHVAALEYADGRWQIFDAGHTALGRFHWVICTAPAAQTARLLPQTFVRHAQVAGTRMVGCYALMLGFDRALPIPWQAALVHDSDISWISVDNSKPGRPAKFTLVMHAANAWSDAHMADDVEQVRTHLLREANDVIGHDLTRAAHADIHRWRFANIEKQDGEKSLLDTERGLAACGDWCVHGRVEGAFASAMDLADRLVAVL